MGIIEACLSQTLDFLFRPLLFSRCFVASVDRMKRGSCFFICSNSSSTWDKVTSLFFIAVHISPLELSRIDELSITSVSSRLSSFNATRSNSLLSSSGSLRFGGSRLVTWNCVVFISSHRLRVVDVRCM